jgi:hypothetical protein
MDTVPIKCHINQHYCPMCYQPDYSMNCFLYWWQHQFSPIMSISPTMTNLPSPTLDHTKEIWQPLVCEGIPCAPHAMSAMNWSWFNSSPHPLTLTAAICQLLISIPYSCLYKFLKSCGKFLVYTILLLPFFSARSSQYVYPVASHSHSQLLLMTTSILFKWW